MRLNFAPLALSLTPAHFLLSFYRGKTPVFCFIGQKLISFKGSRGTAVQILSPRPTKIKGLANMLPLFFRLVKVMADDSPDLSNKCGIDLLIGIGYLWSSGVTEVSVFRGD